MASETSGWYARLDHECPDREIQIHEWLEAWMKSTKLRQPIAAALPSKWPTLPAGLLSDPGAVLDHLLARLEAESDGRSPRGVYATPARFVDAVLNDEFRNGRKQKKEPLATLSLAALPPSFRAIAKQVNENIEGEDASPSDSNFRLDSITKSGIPIPFADPACGAGLFVDRIIRIHSERISGEKSDIKKQDTIKLLEGMQLLDVSELAIMAARKRVLIVLGRLGLVDLHGQGNEESIGYSEAEMIIETNIRIGDPLREEWPWIEKPALIVSRPPWLRIKDRFRGHPNGSQLRKELSKELREVKDLNGKKRFSAIMGNVNLYRLYIERSLQITKKGGRIRIIAPESVLREKSSSPLRKLLVLEHEWDSVWSFPEDNRVFVGGTSGVAVLGVTSGGKTQVLTSFGPLKAKDLSVNRGLEKNAPFLELERGPWSIWTDTTWAVPKMPRNSLERDRTLQAINKLADKPRLTEQGTWLNPSGKSIKVRVGEGDQNSWSEYIVDWDEENNTGFPFVRGAHIEKEGNMIELKHPAFDNDSINDERLANSLWIGPNKMSKDIRIACHAQINPSMDRRLYWTVIPSGCVLGNSVSYLDFPTQVLESLSEKFGSTEDALNAIVNQLNSEEIDLWAKAWAANNNVNNYEIETLPFPPLNETATLSVLGNDKRL